MLPNATVNQLRCAFVSAVYDYFYCKTYSLDCCITEVEELFRLYKLTQVPCDLTPELECLLKEFDTTDFTIDCDEENTQMLCSIQLQVTHSISESVGSLYVHLLNDFNGTAYSYYPVNSNVVPQPNSVYTVLTDSPLISAINGTITVPINYTIYDSNQVNFNPRYGSIQASMTLSTSSHTASYISTIRLDKTDATGTPTGHSIFNLSPLTSPYLSCVGCTTVTASHLYFSNSNWPTAIQSVIKNAVLTESGAVNVDPVAYRDIDTILLGLRVKHNPSGI